jgi:FAD/FMN-containing dehydrogenase
MTAFDNAFALGQTIEIDRHRQQAVVGADVPVNGLRDAAAAAGLRYAHRPARPTATVAEHVAAALRSRSWLRQGSSLSALAEVWLQDTRGTSSVLTRDSRLRTVQRDLVAALDAGSVITHVVVDLQKPATHRMAFLVSFDDRASAARAAESVIALARPVAVDLLDETAMLLVAGFGGLDIYPQGTSLFVELQDADAAVLQRDTRLVEDLCFEQGATAVRESAAHHIADADEALVTACRPVLETLGYTPVHEAAVPSSELGSFVARCDEIQRVLGIHLTVFVDGATGVVTCWPALGTDARVGELARIALRPIG